jgi:hypothetical protein
MGQQAKLYRAPMHSFKIWKFKTFSRPKMYFQDQYPIDTIFHLTTAQLTGIKGFIEILCIILKKERKII